ncbi:hypothetical protein IP84_07430 [beta proteobacterium AAP99]|nr:hypothetical protein IP84_07430 [beta proteobacterium AAP99]
MSTFALLIPDMLLIALGFTLMQAGWFGRNVWEAAERLVYFVLFPALLFTAVARAPVDPGAASALIFASLLVTATGVVLGWWMRPLLRADATRFAQWAGLAQTAFRFNSYVALSLATRLEPAAQATALFALVIAFNVPLCNVFAVLGLAPVRHGGTSPRALLRELAQNPLILATVGGLAFKLAGGQLPEPIWTGLSRLGQAALALGLMAVGAGLSWTGAREAAPLVGWMLSVRLLWLPAAAWVIGALMGLDRLAHTVLVAYAALPTASSAFILAARMGAPSAPVAAVISFGTVAAGVSLPLWLWLLGRFS